MKLDPPARVILDVGAQILELSNLEVAKRWLYLSDASVQAVVFFDEHDELSVINRKDRVEALQTSSFAAQLDVCLVFLDESHTRGLGGMERGSRRRRWALCWRAGCCGQRTLGSRDGTGRV